MPMRTVIVAVLCLVLSWCFGISLASANDTGFSAGLVDDLFVPWNASRVVLAGGNPYSAAVTLQNQRVAYGSSAAAHKDEQRFAYPIFVAFMLVPLALLSFPVANTVAFGLFFLLALPLVGIIRRRWDLTTFVYTILFFSSYPLIVALQIRQLTTLFLALCVGALALLRAGRPIAAGLLAAFCTGKPQLALPFVLPMMVCTLSQWRERKGFAVSFGAALTGLLILTNIATPGWIPDWVDTLRAYSRYSGNSAVAALAGARIGLYACGIVLLMLLVVLWLRRQSDLLLLVSLSILTFQFILPNFVYSEVILVIPAIWVIDNAESIKMRGWMSQLALTSVRVAFVEFWGAIALGLILLHTNDAGKSIAWSIGVRGLMILPITLTCLAVVLFQLFPRDASPSRAG